MSDRASFAALFVLCLSTFGAAGACSAVPDLRFDDGDASGVEGGLDSGRDVDPNCKKTGAEICDDGIDNDCNGDVDCQDVACTPGFSCQDAPQGWTAIGFAAATRPSCPSGATAADLKVVAGDGSATCSCSCTPVGGSCAANSFTLTVTTESTCNVTPVTGKVPPNAAACSPLVAPIEVAAGAFARIAPVGPSSCSATAAPTGGALTSGRVCQAPRFGIGCTPNQVCAPKPAAGLTGCIAKAGANACPAGFTKRNTAGSTGADGRTCNGCACAPPTACTGGTVSVYSDSMCKTNGAFKGAENIASPCAATSDSGFTATHFKAAPAAGGCGATPTTQPTAAGALTFTEPRTVCCR